MSKHGPPKAYLLGVDVAGHGAAVHNFLLDVLIADHAAVLRDGDLRVVRDRVAAQGGVAGHAHVLSRAVAVLGLVLLAGNVRDGVAVNPTHRSVYVTAPAGAGSAAVQEYLDGRDNITLGALGQDLDAIRNSRNRGVRPARAAGVRKQVQLLTRKSRKNETNVAYQ